jgi:hypothetical protein
MPRRTNRCFPTLCRLRDALAWRALLMDSPELFPFAPPRTAVYTRRYHAPQPPLAASLAPPGPVVVWLREAYEGKVPAQVNGTRASRVRGSCGSVLGNCIGSLNDCIGAWGGVWVVLGAMGGGGKGCSLGRVASACELLQRDALGVVGEPAAPAAPSQARALVVAAERHAAVAEAARAAGREEDTAGRDGGGEGRAPWLAASPLWASKEVRPAGCPRSPQRPAGPGDMRTLSPSDCNCSPCAAPRIPHLPAPLPRRLD